MVSKVCTQRCGNRASALAGPASAGLVEEAERKSATASEKGPAMDHYAGIDVSLTTSSVCVLDATGRIVREAKVASEPEALVAFLAGCGHHLACVGLEAGPLSQWLHAGLVEAGLPAVLVETRHVKAALSAMRAKTDRNDAR